MSSSSSVMGSDILGNHSGWTTRWHVEHERVPSHAPVGRYTHTIQNEIQTFNVHLVNVCRKLVEDLVRSAKQVWQA